MEKDYLDVKKQYWVILPLLFTVFIFAPLELYLSNVNEFWFTIKDLLIILIPTLLVFSLVLFIFSIFIYKVSLKFFRGYLAFIFGLGIAIYIQGNYIQIDYGILDGTAINWGQYKYYGILNLLVWIVIIIAGIILAYKKQKIVRIIAFFIMGVQIATISVLLVNANFNKSTSTTITTNKLFELSENENTIIFIVDELDADYTNSLLEKYPEMAENLEDFTYFENTLAAYPFTRGAMPHILTGIRYDNKITFTEYLDKAYKETPLYTALIEKNYNIGLYSSNYHFNKTICSLTENIMLNQTSVSSYSGLGSLFYKLIAFKYSPHFLKQYFWIHTGEFSNYMASTTPGTSLYYTDNVSFYKRLRSQGLTKVQGKNAFRVYHIDGAHPPYTVDENLNETENSSAIQEAYSSFKIIFEYISQMKELGIYENSNIIIMADHGYYDMKQHPTLMIKRSGESHSFKISNVQVSYDDLMATYIDLLGLKTDYEGISVFDLGTEERKRYFYFYQSLEDIWSHEYFPDMIEYVSEYYLGNNVLHPTGTVYKKKKTVINNIGYYKYQLGEVLSFSSAGNGHNSVTLGGFYQDWDGWAWMAGYIARLSLELDKTPDKDLALTCEMPYIRGDRQRVEIYANEKFIEEVELFSGKTFTIGIPKEYLSGNKLDIAFSCKDAFGGDSDPRVFGVGIQSIKIEEGTLQKKEQGNKINR
ncbi:MAG: hypothetical protein ACM3TR_19895 [Caulobacteraceae bacterium]